MLSCICQEIDISCFSFDKQNILEETKRINKNVAYEIVFSTH
jgi:hypothetical protein